MKEEWESDSGATLHMAHTRTGMTAASPGTTVGVAGEKILPVDMFGTFEVGLDQPGSTTKPVEEGCRRVCARTLTEPALHLQRTKAMGKTTHLLQNEGSFGVPRGGVTRFQRLPPLSNRCETDPESRGGAGGGVESARNI